MTRPGSFVLGVTATILADRLFDVQVLTWPALALAITFLLMRGYAYGRRLYT